MAWFYLVLAGICEIGWPIGLKFAATDGMNKFVWSTFAALSMILSGLFLYLAQRQIAMGTAYAVWTGIGAMGAFVLGVIYFKDPLTITRTFSIVLILLGVIGFKLSSH